MCRIQVLKRGRWDFFSALLPSPFLFSRINSQKRPELRGRLSDYRNHSKNSLRSDSFSCRFACLAYATQESKKIPIIVHPINTSSCGMFFERSLMTLFSETNSQSRSPHFVLHVFSDKSSKTFLDKPSDKSITALRASCFFG